MSNVSESDAAAVILRHQKLVNEFFQMLEEEEVAFHEWERYLNQPNAHLALAAAMQYWQGGHEGHVAHVFMGVLKHAFNIMNFNSQRIAQFEEAAKFYGNRDNYELTPHSPAPVSLVTLDRGEKARKALGV